MLDWILGVMGVCGFLGGIAALIWKGGRWFESVERSVHANTEATLTGDKAIREELQELRTTVITKHAEILQDHELRITHLEG